MLDLAKERQTQRVRYIDLCAYILGFVNRKHLMSRFDVKEAWASKDFSAYQSLSNDSLIYDHGLKGYKPNSSFKPLFEHDIDNAVQLMCEGKQSITVLSQFANSAVSYSIESVKPKLSSIYNVFRAVSLNRKVEIEYISLTSGLSSRIIAPHSFIRTGCFIYVRGFDDRSGEFRNFKLNRVINSTFIDSKPDNEHSKLLDEDWNQNVLITIKTNDSLKNKKAIEYDYGLLEGKLEVSVKKSLVMFFLMDWRIAPENEQNISPLLYPLVVDSIVDIVNSDEV